MQTISLNVGEYKLPVTLIPNSKSTVAILSHGFSSDPFSRDYIFHPLTEMLTGYGISVANFPYRGGPTNNAPYIINESDGKKKEVVPFFMSLESRKEDLSAVIHFCRAREYTKIILMGASLGGTTVLSAYDHDISALVLMWTPFHLSETVAAKHLKPESGDSAGSPFSLWGKHVGNDLAEEIRTTNVFPLLHKVACPVLFLHGEMDEKVSFTQSERAYALTAERRKRIVLLKNAGHDAKGYEQPVVDMIEGFLIENGLKGMQKKEYAK